MSGELGKVGRRVARNVRQLREQQHITYAELARMLDQAGRPIPVLGLRRIECGERRVDVDDAAALAGALNVPAHRLIFEDNLLGEWRLS